MKNSDDKLFQFPILSMNYKYFEQLEKIKEEIKELENYSNDKNFDEEIFDIIQASLYLLKFVKDKKSNELHKIKLKKRSWDILGEYIIELKYTKDYL